KPWTLMIRILLVDDQKSIREVLRVVLDLDPEMKVVGTASDGYTAIEQVEILKPDLVLIDIEMPGMDGFSSTRSICQAVPGTKVLILSMHQSDEYVSKSLEAGAIGYLIKNTPAHELRESIRFIFNDHLQQTPQRVDDWWKTVNTAPPSNASIVSNAHLRNGERSSSVRFHPSENFVPNASVRAVQPYTQNLSASPNASFNQWNETEGDRTAQRQKMSLRWKLGSLLGIGLIWGLALLYLWKTPPTYTSKWSITLPAVGSSAFVTLPDIGQATSSDESPFNSQAADPRETYKALVMTDEVIDQASTALEMTTQEFGKPRIQVVLNTTLMKFEMPGLSPLQARQKAIALHQAFENRLTQLRQEEIEFKNQKLEVPLEKAKQKLEVARDELTQFQTRTGLESSEQLRDLSQNAELLRRQRAETTAQLEQSIARSRRLSLDIGLTVNEASDAFALDSDALFQQHLNNYNQASAAVVSLTAQFNQNFPTVLDQVDAQKGAERALLAQGKLTLGKPVTLSYLKKLSLQRSGESNSNREALLQELLSLKNQEKGLQEQSQELARQITQFENKLKVLSSQNATLGKLERDVTIAEAIFSSTLTRQDLSQANQSASYPPVSIVAQPNLPDEPSSPKTLFVLAGALISSLFILTFMISLWWRSRHRRQAPVSPTSSAITSLSKSA
ncbi:MAG: response regulator, partial [Cyanobacteria bacterium P01_F01_bin.3]